MRGAVVVMDVRTGDVLAMVSSPAIDPNYWVGGLPADEFQKETARLNDPKLRPEINRATQENYAPGSIFKPIVGLAALENGLDPNASYNPENPKIRGMVYIMAGGKSTTRRRRANTISAAPSLSPAIPISSPSACTGIEKIVRLAEKFHFGERTGLPTRQETKGIFPTLEQVQSPDWRDGNTANICIGQGEMDVTPMQMAVAYSAIANGGKVLWPRLVERIEPQDPASGDTVTNFPAGLVRDQIGVSARNLNILHDAMLAETETKAPARRRRCLVCGFAARPARHR